MQGERTTVMVKSYVKCLYNHYESMRGKYLPYTKILVFNKRMYRPNKPTIERSPSWNALYVVATVLDSENVAETTGF